MRRRVTKIRKKNSVNGNFDYVVPIGAMATDIEMTNGQNAEQNILKKINKPIDSPDGISGQILKTLGDGNTQWVNSEAVSDEQVAAAFHAWQQENPGWTTTIGPGAVKQINLDEDAVTSEKIKQGEVKTDNIDNGAVTEAKIATNAISALKLAPNSVSYTKIQNNAIRNYHIQPRSITTEKIGLKEVKKSNIDNNAFSSEKIGQGEVKTININDEAVTDAKLASCDVTDTDVRENIAQGETRATIFGKIKKWFTDLAPLLIESEWHKASTKEDPLPYGFKTIDVKRRGKLVQVKLGADVLDESNLDSNGWKTIVTLPNEYWPTVVGPYNESSTQSARIIGEVNTTTAGVKINVQDFGIFLTTVRTNGELQITVTHGNKPGSPYSKLIGWINATYWYFIN